LSDTIRIGTRDSKLALWQAYQVRDALQLLGITCELVPVKSPGDIDLSTPLHQFGTTGIFTKILDDALYADKIDIAVHSLKDYPTESPEGLVLPAVLERGPHEDILVHKGDLNFLKEDQQGVIATGSIRRIAQWKSRYPKHQTSNLRGNVQTRLQKLQDNNWHGAVFAKAGLQRVNLLPENHIVLDWMIPAPAQGVVAIGCREADVEIVNLLKKIDHRSTHLRATCERAFLNQVEGGCSAPVGAFSEVKGDNIFLNAGVFEIDGSTKAVIKTSGKLEEAETLGRQAADQVLKDGGMEIMQKIRNA